VIIFPDQAFENLPEFFGRSDNGSVQPPEFCLGLVAPTIVVTGRPNSLAQELELAGVTISGVIPYHPFSGEILKASRPAEKWTQVLGSITVSTVRPSLTDPIRLRVEVIPERDLAPMIPLMARLIRGGSYRLKFRFCV
jgi:hypothetical protein